MVSPCRPLSTGSRRASPQHGHLSPYESIVTSLWAHTPVRPEKTSWPCGTGIWTTCVFLVCGDARKRNNRNPPQGRRQANRPTGPRQLLVLSLPLSHARLHPHRDNAPIGCALGNHWKLSTTPARKATNKPQELACVPLKGPNRNDVPARKPQARHNSLARTYRNRSGKATKRPRAQSPTHTHTHTAMGRRRLGEVSHMPRDGNQMRRQRPQSARGQSPSAHQDFPKRPTRMRQFAEGWRPPAQHPTREQCHRNCPRPCLPRSGFDQRHGTATHTSHANRRCTTPTVV